MSIASTLYKAIGRSVLGRYMTYAANLLSLALLARIFSPETFGVTAYLMAFLLFFQLMIEAGLGPAIINLEKLSTEERDGIFGLTIITGAALGIGFYLLKPIFIQFYNNPLAGEVVSYIAASLVFFAASILPTAFLLREQSFLLISKAGIISEVISTASAVVLSHFIPPAHALAAKSVISAATNFSFLYFFSSSTEFGRPMLGSRFSAVRPLLSFSAYQFGFNFLNFFSRNLDNILVGKYIGASALGYYDKAYQLMRYPLMLLSFAMTPAIQPALRKHSGDPKKIEAIHLDFTFKLSIVGAAAGAATYILAKWIVLILLGPQWTEVIPIIKILAIGIPAQVVLSTSGSFFQAMNRTDLLFKCGLFSASITSTAIAIGIYQKNVLALSAYIIMAFHINFIQAYYMMHKHIFISSPRSFYKNLTPAALTTLLIALLAQYS